MHAMVYSRLALVALTLLFNTSLFSQTLVGYTNSEVLITSHPNYGEAQKNVDNRTEVLGIWANKAKENITTKLSIYQKKKENGADPAELKELEREITQLSQEYEANLSQKADALQQFNDEQFEPIIKDINKAFELVAKNNNLDAIFQAVNDEGVSFVLYAPDESGINADVLKAINASGDFSEITPFSLDPKKVKIGYTNIELVIAYMPESRRMEEALKFYTDRLVSDFSVKQKTRQTLLEYYNAETKPDKKKYFLQQIHEINAEMDHMEAAFEEKLQARRNELMQPILDKAQAAIDRVAKKNKLTYVINQTNSSGISTIVFGPDNCDMTPLLLKELGAQNNETDSDFKPASNLKVGYVNVEMFLSKMPEVASISKQVDAYQNDLIKQAQSQGVDPYSDSDAEQEILTKVSAKRNELLSPVMNEIQTAIDQVAEAKGYDFVINQTGSNVIHVKDEHNLSEDLEPLLGL
ncbi:MAG: hypothetical protein Crog4KO_12040 [Crocinitomicaceae bacterium]